MTTRADTHDLLPLIPSVDHPTFNAMRNALCSDKIRVPVRLYKNGQQVYAADVRMFGHSHSLYRAALDATLGSIAARAPAIEWDQVGFHSDKKVDKADVLTDEASLSTYITLYRTVNARLALLDALDNLNKVAQKPAASVSRSETEHSMLRLCGAIISASVEVIPDPAYAPRQNLLRRIASKMPGLRPPG